MAYTDDADLIRAAGGQVNLIELADLDRDGVIDPLALSTAQALADGWIDFKVRRQSADILPLGGGDIDAVDPFVRALAAREAIYQLKLAIGMAVDVDHRLHDERAGALDAWASGIAVTINDPYPVGSANTPAVVESTTSTTTTAASGADFTAWGFL